MLRHIALADNFVNSLMYWVKYSGVGQRKRIKLLKVHICSVTRFFQRSLPKCSSNFTKLRKILPNVGFPNNYVIIMPKNNSYVIKVEKICTKRYLEILVAFIVLQFLLILLYIMIRLKVLSLGSSVHHFEHVTNKKHIFLPKWY